MALNTASLKAGIKQALLDQRDITADPQAAADKLAGDLASIFETYVKSLEVIYSAGLVAPSGGGAVTGTIIHTIN